MTYLGFTINKSGYSPSTANIDKVTSFPIPKNVKNVQTFLGMTNYFGHLIFKYAEIAHPVFKLSFKITPFICSQECQSVFVEISH